VPQFIGQTVVEVFWGTGESAEGRDRICGSGFALVINKFLYNFRLCDLGYARLIKWLQTISCAAS
jgi:hypothetical protein